MQLLYKAVGSGTNRLASTNSGQQLELLTPLGNPFPKPDSTAPHILIAGGVGLPPMLSWSEIYGQSADVLCFGGRDGGKMVGLADPFLIVPSNDTPRIQEMHITLGHMLCGALEMELGLL